MTGREQTAITITRAIKLNMYSTIFLPISLSFASYAIIIADIWNFAKFFIYCTDNDDSCTLYGIHHVLL